MSKETFSSAARHLLAWPGLGVVALAAALTLSGCRGPIEEPTAGTSETPPIASAGSAESQQRAAPLEYPTYETVAPGENASYNQRASLVQRGHQVYAKYCIGCHGAYGDGKGPAAERLLTQPRDFTSGIYKFRSTDSGSLPLETDLERTLTRGLARVSMPAFPLMPVGEKVAVIEYIKSFYPDWEAEKGDRRVVPIPQPPTDLAREERRLRGRMVYLQMGCASCHGVDGRGTGATQTEYVDAWGQAQEPFDFTRGSLKGGNSPEDIYRTFHTGLRSIMPSFGGETLAAVTTQGFEGLRSSLEVAEADQLASVLDAFPADGSAIYDGLDPAQRQQLVERNSWDLVVYILSLRTPSSTAAAVLGTS